VYGNWQRTPGLANDIGVGSNGTAYIIGTDVQVGGFSVYKWNGSNWDLQNGAGSRIDVSPQGIPWLVNSSKQIWRGNGGNSFNQLPGLANDIGIGADGTVYIIGTDAQVGGFSIYKWNGSNWDLQNGAGVRIDVSPQGIPWLVNSSKQIWRGIGGNSFEQLPGLANDIGIGSDGSVYIIGTDAMPGGYGIYKWNGSNWTKINGAGEQISAGSQGIPWMVDSFKEIYRGK
jgi:hypothetical protein